VTLPRDEIVPTIPGPPLSRGARNNRHVTIDEFRAALDARGGEADVWLVYLAHPYEVLTSASLSLALQGAFWTRGEAYAFAHGRRQRRVWNHLYVFRLTVDTRWAMTEEPRRAEFETEFGRVRELPAVSVTAAQAAAAFG